MKTVSDFPFMEIGQCGHIRDYHREKRGRYDFVATGCGYPGCGYVGTFRGTGQFANQHPGLGEWHETKQEWVQA